MHNNKNLFWGRIKWICFIIYCVLLLLILFCRHIPSSLDLAQYPYWKRILDNINLIPFDTISFQFHDIIHDSGYYEYLALLNLSANIIMFIPMGFFLPILWKKLEKLSSCTLTGVMIILAVEIVQLFSLLGSFDIDDVILNCIGIIIGFFLQNMWNLFHICHMHHN